ncbi:MAG: UDP-N-acetylmuramate--L-alanine ligase [Deltaproteobacteria bacterium]|nr:UDP-N-acetylmuramate--L-alanine ligase [Deltaproteobacteria bacterium]
MFLVDRPAPGGDDRSPDQPASIPKTKRRFEKSSSPDSRCRDRGTASVNRVHLIAACGVGMASLAGMMKERGFRVTGSDANVYPPMSAQLEALGIPLLSPYAAENIPGDADLVVVGNAVSRDNPEAAEAARRGLPVLSMPQAVARFFIAGKESIVVAGTHGKTTTTSLLAWSLFDLGDDPSFLVGGVPRNFPVSYRLGAGPRFVIEGDEYDTAWFDKGPKFLHYLPQTVLLTSIEFDHADIYRDLSHLKDSFLKLVRIIPPDGLLIACADYPDVVDVAEEASCPVCWYATAGAPFPAGAESCRVRALAENGGYSRFRLEGGVLSHEFRLRLPGRHNAANGAAVAIALLRLGYGPDRVAGALAGFTGVRRRQEVLGEFGGVLVIDDFAHHPTAVRETIRAVRARYTGRRVTAVFEPRSNTSRRKVFQGEFACALSEADAVILAGVFGAEKIPPGERLAPEEVVEAVRGNGREAFYIEEVDRIVLRLSETSRPGDLILIMSNGGFGGIQGKLTQTLAARR